MTKQEFCEKFNLTDDQYYGKEWSYYNNNETCQLTSLPDGFNPKVDGDLYLNSLIKLPIGFNPVAEALWLGSLIEIPKWFNPKVDNIFLGEIPVPENWKPTYAQVKVFNGQVERSFVGRFDDITDILDFINFNI